VAKPLRVLQLGTVGPLYGAERWILALIRNLDPARIESHVAVIADQPGADAPLLDAAIQLSFKGHSIQAPGRFNWAAVRGLRHLVAQGGFDIVHSHGYKADIITWLALRGTATKIVSTPHGWSVNAGRKLQIYEALGRRALRRFDAVVPLSDDLYNGLVTDRSTANRLHKITNGVDIAEIVAPTVEPTDLTSFRGDGPVIGYIGQLIARKDIATLIDAFARWHRDDARLVLVGEGDDRAALEAQAQSLGIARRLLFTGFRPDRLAWLKSFDAFVLPSQLEGIPRCLMEAMVAGVPVIASDIPGNRDIVQHDRTGLLFPVGDVAALTLALDRAIAPEAAVTTQAAQDLIHNRYSAQAMASAYADLFEGLVQ
jgi:glycosyltransferase involved in cell wall biosynthesis